MTQQTTWIDDILAANSAFRERIVPDQLPTTRTPGPAVITCMDPRVNLEAIGIPGFAKDGSNSSPVRVIRTLGAMADNRSLIVGIFLAGFREIVVLMHTDCGCCLAYSKVDVIVANMQQRLSSQAFEAFRQEIGEPFGERLRDHLKAFEDPRLAVQQEVESIYSLPFAPADLVVHGLVYDLGSGSIEVIINGYDATHRGRHITS